MMTTVNRVLWSMVLLAVIAGFAACDEPVDCHPEEPTITEPFLISYFDALEFVLYYADEHWEGVLSDPYVLEADPTTGSYQGYNLAGEVQIYPIQFVPVGLADIDALSEEHLAIYTELLAGLPPEELAGMAAPSRRHVFKKCGALEAGITTCENTSDSTSIERIYEAFKRCERTTTSTDTCTEFNVHWYTEKAYDHKDCSGGSGQVIKVEEHKDWRCY